MRILNILRIGIVVAILLSIIGFVLYQLDVFVFDHSAVVSGNVLEWKGRRYVRCDGVYELAGTLAKTSDTGHAIVAVKGDAQHHFLLERVMLDSRLYVAEDYTVPESGELTSVYLEAEKKDDPALLKALSAIFAADGAKASGFDPSAISARTAVTFCYDGCDVGTDNKGYVAKVGDRWIAAVYHGDTTEYRFVDAAYIDVLEQHTAPNLIEFWVWSGVIMAAVSVLLILGAVKTRNTKNEAVH